MNYITLMTLSCILCSTEALAQAKQAPAKKSSEIVRQKVEEFAKDSKTLDKIKEAFKASDNGKKIDANKPIAYDNDAQIVADVAAALHKRPPIIVVAIEGFDSEQMVPGVITLANAVKRGPNKKLFRCYPPGVQSGGLIEWIIPVILKETLDLITDAIKEHEQVRRLQENASEYYLRLHLDKGKRYTTRLELVKYGKIEKDKRVVPGCKDRAT